MRWRYHDPTNTAETAEREQVVVRIDRWWSVFADRAGDLRELFRRRQKWDLPAWMCENLGAVSPQLRWEFGPAVSGGEHRLIITPESECHLRPMVEVILERVPKIDGWEFYGYRLPEDLDLAEQMVKARTGGTTQDIVFNASIGRGHRIDLMFKSTSGRDANQVRHDAFVAIETLLGEEVLDKWIGVIDAERQSGGIMNWFRGSRSAGLPLGRLRPTVDAVVDSIREQLPPQPLCVKPASGDQTLTNVKGEPVGAVFKLTPRQQEEYPGTADLFVATSHDKELWTATHGGSPFYSCRYSRHSETFCYLKIDGRGGLDQERFKDRVSIEDAIDAALIPKHLGCFVGGGTGLIYSYIDLALTNVPDAVREIRGLLRAGNIPKRTWLLFYDTDLASEWIGMWDDTPAPPGLPGSDAHA